jgi:glycosyltransferase involved in cell wall biosynthesis
MLEPAPDLSIVILCYRNGESTIPFVQSVIGELRKGKITNYELVLVANYLEGIDDSTPEVVQRLADTNPSIVPVIHKKEGMMGWDVITGLGATTGEVIALIDGDGQMPPADIVRLYRVLKSGEFDFVKTYRQKRFDGPFRLLTSRLFNGLFSIFFPRVFFRDINSKPKMWSRAALKQQDLQCTGWFSDGEIILEARRLDFSFAEIPTTFQKNEWRASFVGLATILEMLVALFYYRLIYWFK